MRIFFAIIVRRWRVRGTGTGMARWGSRGRKTDTWISLFAGHNRFIENRTVNFRDIEIVIKTRIVINGGTEGEGVKFILREEAKINGYWFLFKFSISYGGKEDMKTIYISFGREEGFDLSFTVVWFCKVVYIISHNSIYQIIFTYLFWNTIYFS